MPGFPLIRAGVVCIRRFSGFFGRVREDEVVHHQYFVGDREVFAAAAYYEDGGDAFIGEGADYIGEWGYRFVFDELFHSRVADHEVCRAEVFVDEKQLRAGGDGFGDVRCLRGGAGGVRGREVSGVAARESI